MMDVLANSDSDYNVVVLISADIEWRVIGEIFPSERMEKSPYGEWFQPSGFEQRVIFFHGGWGKIAAAGSTQYVIDRWHPDLLVNLGTCGGFAGEIEQGEIILAERTVVYDIIEQMGDYDEHIAHYATDIDLTWLGAELPHPVRRTLLVSADRDLLVEEIPRLKADFGAVAGDWESGAIAWVAARNAVRCLILRAVSDVVGAEGSQAYGDIEFFYAETQDIMAQLVEMLPAWLVNQYPA
jgi:adenosylhomocysteine nucleosidase